jgi:hypothetical protein
MNQSSSNQTGPSVKDYFELFREKIVHEDDLISNRTNWLLGFQGLLFTAYGILFESSTTSHADKEPLISTDALIHAIPIAGIFISVMTILSVLGAVITMHQTKKDWTNWTNRESSRSTKEKFPEVMTTRFPMVLGFVSPFGIPIFFIVAWIMIRPCVN